MQLIVFTVQSEYVKLKLFYSCQQRHICIGNLLIASAISLLPSFYYVVTS